MKLILINASIQLQQQLDNLHHLISIFSLFFSVSTVKNSINSVQEATLEQLEQLEQLYLNTKSSDQIKEINVQVFEKQLNQNTINEILIFLIAVQNLLFQMI